jgi:hypothetical protein
MPHESLLNQRFGRWIVIAYEGIYRVNGEHKGHLCRCRCDCGNEKVLQVGVLRRGLSRSCGCLLRETVGKSRRFVGKRFGRLTVLKRTDQKRGAAYLYQCRCDCGNEVITPGAPLTSSATRSCGCLKQDAAQHRVRDLTGLRFHRLVVLRQSEERKSNRVTFLCLCDCGTEILVAGNALVEGITQSCGCYRRDRSAQPHGVAAFNNVYGEYRRGAQGRGFTFDLTEDTFRSLTQQPCHYCGGLPSTVSKKSPRGDFIYNGIDRVDNTQGYTLANCLPCCQRCNVAKGTLTYNDFIAMARAIAARHPE